jgi:DNA repair protein RecN (Recombination protein N)
MITNLHIKNIGIIDDIEIDFNKGLNVLTGETGAGKSLIIGSLNIISGGRFSKDMIRKGETNSFVEVCLYEPKNENSIDGTIIISREINVNGKNVCKINGRMVTVTELKEFMRKIIEIHGQNDSQNLLDNKEHIKYLDSFIGNELEKEEYRKNYERYIEIKKELKENYGDEKERQRKLDLLKYQFEEIEEANLIEGEEEELSNKQKIIVNSEKIAKTLQEVDISIGENAIDIISNSIRNLEKIECFDEKYQETANCLKSAYYELQEVSRDISSFKDEVDFNEEEQREIEERLDLIFSLKRKYGNSIKEILQYKEEVKSEIYRIDNLEEYTSSLKSEQKELTKKLNELGEKIHKIREEKGEELSNKINQNLKDLEMKNAKVNIHVDYFENEYFENGKDRVIFYITTNVGEDEKELSKIASGGEMSRIMLAIKAVLANSDDISVLIFDEIDTGISGKAANSVAEKLNTIAKKHQVLCISHLPNIAAVADYHYFISKNIAHNRTSTSIKQLNEKEIIKEIARISSGEVNDITIKYAEKLRKKKIAI